MRRIDARKLNGTELQSLRRKAIALACEGKLHQEVAAELGVSRSAIAKWLRLWRAQGENALAPQPRGRPSGTGALSDAAMRLILDALCNHTLEEFALAVKLWSNRAIRSLMRSKNLPPVTPTTVFLWMRQWGFHGPQPSVDLIGEYDDEVSASALWHLQEYPQVKRLARKHSARILLFDERPLPDTLGLCKRPRYLLCAFDGRGTLRFSVAHYPVTAAKRTDFMERLTRDIGRPIVLLLDSHPNHKNRTIHKWQCDRAESISLVHIPISDLCRLPPECWPFRNMD